MENLLLDLNQSPGGGTGFWAGTEVAGAGLLENFPFCGSSVIPDSRF